jgi:hypothetical protein
VVVGVDAQQLLRNVKIKENYLNADSRRCSAMGFARADTPLAETQMVADIPTPICVNLRLICVYPR